VPKALPSGWYRGAVKVVLTAADGLSGVAKTYYRVGDGETRTYSGDGLPDLERGRHKITFWSVDEAGNVEDNETPGQSIVVQIDDLKPTITGSRTPAAGQFGWNNGPVDVSFTCKDEDSGIAGCVGDARILEETTREGVSLDGTASDIAGNVSSAQVGPIKVDLTKPTLSGAPTTEPSSAEGWYRGDVAINWSGQDGLSGIDEATLPQNSVITGEGTELSAGPATVKDKAGNESDPARSAAVSIDRTAPSVAGKIVDREGADRAPNADGWFNSAVRVKFACADALSTIAECPADVVLGEDGRGLSAKGTATDKAGNTAETTVPGINIDSTLPVTRAEVKCSGANGYCRDSATVSFTAVDPGELSSGAKEIEYRINDGAWQTAGAEPVTVRLDGSGKVEVSYRATDKAGNTEDVKTTEIKHDSIAPRCRTPCCPTRRTPPVGMTGTPPCASARPTTPTAPGSRRGRSPPRCSSTRRLPARWSTDGRRTRPATRAPTR
jgi:hypothetical protein